ncbi:MAG: hypothetical protein ACI4PW_00500 [Alphaproteobacteria bacterium]|jgi:uncharacterized membrane protein
MSSELNIRRMLACLNVSVFSESIVPGLRKRAEAFVCEREDGMPFSVRAVLHGAAAVMALCLFAALRSLPYALAVGGAGAVLAGAAFVFAKGKMLRLFLWACFTAFELSAVTALSAISPFGAAFLAFAVFVWAGREGAETYRQIFSTLIFCFFWGAALYTAVPGHAVDGFAVLSVPGFVFLARPTRRACGKAASSILLVLPPGLLLFCCSAALDGSFLCSAGVGVSLVFCIETFLLAFWLWQDMDGGERVCAVFLGILAGAAALWGLPGAVGSALIMLLAFFIDSVPLAVAGAVLLTCFAGVGLLSGSVGFGGAALTCGAAGLGALFLQHHAERKEGACGGR